MEVRDLLTDQRDLFGDGQVLHRVQLTFDLEESGHASGLPLPLRNVARISFSGPVSDSTSKDSLEQLFGAHIADLRICRGIVGNDLHCAVGDCDSLRFVFVVHGPERLALRRRKLHRLLDEGFALHTDQRTDHFDLVADVRELRIDLRESGMNECQGEDNVKSIGSRGTS